MRRFVVTFVTFTSIAGVATPVGSQVTTPCFSAQAFSRPTPVVAGYSRVRVTNAGGEAWADSFFDLGLPDGWLAGYSLNANSRAGTSDCDMNPDVRAVWGYTASDDSPAFSNLLTVSVTAYALGMADPPSGSTCAITSNPIIQQYQVNTGPDKSWYWNEAGSTLFVWDLVSCDAAHDYHQIRIRAISGAPGISNTDEGCFVVPVQPTCPGNGANCL